ncbi:MAG TPA: class I SAM-dependent methyltransferase [Pyrinomonadaceae bacterium]|nr:class I SAM-dependent methyltransferase [Pyrinomonadaceae bacterium]
MPDDAERPFYAEYAWAYDFIITRPITRDCSFIAEQLSSRRVNGGAGILDAGCGTGRYALELARLGYTLTGLDLSAQLLALAQQRTADAGLHVALVRGDILALPFTRQFDAVLCRGVLNDLLDDGSRQKVFASFAGALRPGGVLILDVREWHATVGKKSRQSVFEKAVETPLGVLTFRSETHLDYRTRQLHVTERHALKTESGETVVPYDLLMRCWTREELDNQFAAAGFVAVDYFGDYDGEASPGATDRLVGVATLG